jgi:hypothetical protein
MRILLVLTIVASSGIGRVIIFRYIVRALVEKNVAQNVVQHFESMVDLLGLQRIGL